LRAIDLYSGIGGWTVGLQLAGIKVVAAYEWWGPAAETYEKNLGKSVTRVDIRTIDLNDLPQRIDIVVGSPPCTEFSYSNRGGNGDLAEGLKDIVRFFEIVAHVRPKFWAMENVPRVAQIVREGLTTRGHPLYKFRSLRPNIETLDFSDFGLPQARKRCLIGRLPVDWNALRAARRNECTLGDVIAGLARHPRIIDPVWGTALPTKLVTEMQKESALDAEQLRMNREAKAFHPVYNNMAFPDELDLPARTVTATCTRVSRESIIIRDSLRRSLRRLTIRERASLQGFPITYQFFGSSYSQKVKLVGNAFPPPIAFVIGWAARTRKAPAIADLHSAGATLSLPAELPKQTPPEKRATTYVARRRFQSALPNLRLKSGVRFDLTNFPRARSTQWIVRFHYGPSKSVQRLTPTSHHFETLGRNRAVAHSIKGARTKLLQLEAFLNAQSPEDLQLVWARRRNGQSPYVLVDLLGTAALAIQTSLRKHADNEEGAREIQALVDKLLATGGARTKFARSRKVTENSITILAGLIVSSWYNSREWHSARQP